MRLEMPSRPDQIIPHKCNTRLSQMASSNLYILTENPLVYQLQEQQGRSGKDESNFSLDDARDFSPHYLLNITMIGRNVSK